MSQLASDNFTRANSTGLGANWTANSHDGNPAGFDIISNTAQPHSTAGDSSDLYTGVASPNDQYSEVTFSATAADGAGTGSGPMCRCSTGALTYYRCIGNASGYQVAKAVAGSGTSLSSGTGTTFTAGDKLRLEVQGTTWRVFKNNVQFDAGTDSSIASGDFGISYSSTSSSQANAGLSLWTGGDFSSGPGLMGQIQL